MLVNHPRINTAINWVLTTLSRIDKGIRTSVDTTARSAKRARTVSATCELSSTNIQRVIAGTAYVDDLEFRYHPDTKLVPLLLAHGFTVGHTPYSSLCPVDGILLGHPLAKNHTVPLGELHLVNLSACDRAAKTGEPQRGTVTAFVPKLKTGDGQ
jgi:hypothetical protein